MCKPQVCPLDERGMQTEGCTTCVWPRHCQKKKKDRTALCQMTWILAVSTGSTSLPEPTGEERPPLLRQWALPLSLRREASMCRQKNFLSARQTTFSLTIRRTKSDHGSGTSGRRIQPWFRDIFKAAGKRSLLLLNESFSTTSFEEGYYIARDVVRILKRLGVRTIYNTHMHKLAREAETLNKEETGDSQIASLVAETEDGQRSYGYGWRLLQDFPMPMTLQKNLESPMSFWKKRSLDPIPEKRNC